MAHRNLVTANGNSPGRFTRDLVDGHLVLRATGRWDIDSAGRLDEELRRMDLSGGIERATFDLARLEALDTAGAWLIDRTRRAIVDRQIEFGFEGVQPAHRMLIDEVGRAPAAPTPFPEKPSPLLELVEKTGRATVNMGREAVQLIGFFGLLVVRIGHAVARPARLRGVSLVYHVEATGLSAIPIVGLLSFLIGVVLAYQGASQLRQFGAEIFVVNLLGISILRELGILLTAIIVAGRSGSAFTAQIGTMKVSQEVDAMRTLGLDPIDTLVLPRLLALMLSLPLLVFYADLVALFGGATMSYFVLDISYGQFIRQFQAAVPAVHFWVGMVKAPVFAFTIAMIGCYEGLNVGGSAESVGRLTTKAVVQSIFLVIVLDALFSILFAGVGL